MLPLRLLSVLVRSDGSFGEGVFRRPPRSTCSRLELLDIVSIRDRVFCDEVSFENRRVLGFLSFLFFFDRFLLDETVDDDFFTFGVDAIAHTFKLSVLDRVDMYSLLRLLSSRYQSFL